MPRPQPDFDGFIGQRNTVRYICQLLKGCLELCKPFPHCLFAGPSGMGKTELSRVIAKQMETDLHTITDPRRLNIQLLAETAEKIEACDFVFVDEAHTLPVKMQEAMFNLLNDNLRPVVDSQSGRVEEEVDVPPFTMLFATDQPGSLIKAFKTRMHERIDFEPYTENEMVAIIRRRATEKSLVVTAQAARLLARASRNNPRRGGHTISLLHSYLGAKSLDPNSITKEQAQDFLHHRGIDEQGFSRFDRAMLTALSEAAPLHLSLNTLSARIGMDCDSILADVEPYLLQQGLITITSSGRNITIAGQTTAQAFSQNNLSETSL